MINCEFEHGHKVSLRHVTVDAIVIRGDEILLVKRADGHIEGGKYALPGGFLDRGETCAEAVLRELKEETGYEAEVKELFLINDSPERRGEDRQNVTFVFLLDALERVGSSDDEIETISWFKLNELPPREKIAFDHLDVIRYYLFYLEKKFKTPSIGIQIK